MIRPTTKIANAIPIMLTDVVVSYAGHPFYAKEKILITNKSARLSREDRKYAEKKGVKIDRISAKSRPKKKKSWWE